MGVAKGAASDFGSSRKFIGDAVLKSKREGFFQKKSWESQWSSWL